MEATGQRLLEERHATVPLPVVIETSDGRIEPPFIQESMHRRAFGRLPEQPDAGCLAPQPRRQVRQHEHFQFTRKIEPERAVLRRRIDAARHLLLTTREPIGTIATRVGLPDPQYFNKQFRRFVGMSPTDFRA